MYEIMEKILRKFKKVLQIELSKNRGKLVFRKKSSIFLKISQNL